MSNLRKIPKNELNNLSKDAIIMLFLQLSDSFEMQSQQLDILQKQNEKLSSQISDLQESIAVLTQHRFGRKTEKSNTFVGQLTFDFETMSIINEAEKLLEDGEPEEPGIETVVRAHVRKKTKASAKKIFPKLNIRLRNITCLKNS